MLLMKMLFSLVDDKYFSLTYINAGKKFEFNELNLIIAEDFERKNTQNLTKFFQN